MSAKTVLAFCVLLATVTTAFSQQQQVGFAADIKAWIVLLITKFVLAAGHIL